MQGDHYDRKRGNGFEGSINEFNELIKPGSLVVGMSQIPDDSSFEKIQALDGVSSISKVDSRHIKIDIGDEAEKS